MKIVRKRILLRLLLISFLSISLHNHVFSQFGGGGPFGGDPSPDDPGDPQGDGDPLADPDLQVPVDTNVLVLVVGVVGYGLKKMWDVKRTLKRKTNSANTTANYENFIK